MEKNVASGWTHARTHRQLKSLDRLKPTPSTAWREMLAATSITASLRKQSFVARAHAVTLPSMRPPCPIPGATSFLGKPCVICTDAPDHQGASLIDTLPNLDGDGEGEMKHLVNIKLVKLCSYVKCPVVFGFGCKFLFNHV